MNDVYSAILNAYTPRLVSLGNDITAAVFQFMKVFPAISCLKRAHEDGLVTSRSLIIESSSGNMALGLALACNLSGNPLTIVSDYACDAGLRQRIEHLGARVELVSKPSSIGGYQQARLSRLAEIRAENPDHWWVDQYDNPDNPGAYSFLAEQIVGTIGQIDCLVGTVGSGGSVCGTATFLRELFPEMTTVGVDTFGSVLFGQQDEMRELRGLGNSLLPQNLDHSVFDEVHWVGAAEAYTATRLLHRETSLFCGGTSGAAWMVARYWAARNRGARVVCIFPDDGHRYIQTIYNDQYLHYKKLWRVRLPESPVVVKDPGLANSGWSCMQWGRRSYVDALTPAGSLAK